ncbi:hypothetical protein IT084_01800 [Desulfallas sp. Bu1-1]|uniref:hypothetical protein n=1 Tax=Desulfallas sp. Bu1-1 TaxID=2787620 RepID=UPI00189EB8BA|nr:hypothetical protein [Desulfallas sp. Bu1-1]MBF7081715.1 hypothetical protein [Desulfallas sp. Bu1-1]
MNYLRRRLETQMKSSSGTTPAEAAGRAIEVTTGQKNSPADAPPAQAAGRNGGAAAAGAPNGMQSVADVLPAAVRADRLVCRRCGREVTFAPGQWRKTCGRCGLVITITGLTVMERRQGEREPDCFLCGDRGLVFYQEQRGGLVYDFVARCTCRAGQERGERGLPRVDQVDNICSLDYLAMKNRREWEKRTGRRAGITLLTEAEEIPAKEIPF